MNNPSEEFEHPPIQVYSWPTPNGHKVHILLEELELPYTVTAIDISKGDQFHDDFLAISPNNKIPVIIDPLGPEGEPYTVFESGAILLYLATKQNAFLGETANEEFDILQWLMFQMGSVGPMLGQAHHFMQYAPEKIDYAINRYYKEAQRIYGVINKRLEQSEYIACHTYSIADIAIFPWLVNHEKQNINLQDYPALKNWYQRIAERPAVKRGLKILAEHHTPVNETSLKILFGVDKK